MNSFLRHSRERFLTAAASKPSPSEVVSGKPKSLITIGNEAGDIDSIVSSIATAFGIESHSEQPLGSSALFGDVEYRPTAVPVMPFPRKDLRLRQDVVHLFTRVGLDPKNLVYWDDVEAHPNWGLLEGLVLLDHNNPSTRIRTRFPGPVIGIIDHHKDDEAFLDALIREVDDSSGSACSGVARILLDTVHLKPSEDADGPSCLPMELLTMLQSAILLDTRNFDPKEQKFNDRDITLMERLQALNETLNPKTTFEELLAARFDVSGFSVTDLLKLDYKHLSAPRSTGGTIEIGFSSIMDTSVGLRSRAEDEEQFKREFVEYANSLGLDILIAFTKKDSEMKAKGVLAVTTDPKFEEILKSVVLKLQAMPEGLDPELSSFPLFERQKILTDGFKLHQDERFTSVHGFFISKNVTRKVLLPTVKSIVAKM